MKNSINHLWRHCSCLAVMLMLGVSASALAGDLRITRAELDGEKILVKGDGAGDENRVMVYNADTGEGCGVQDSDSFYHWGGLLGLMALMEQGER